MLHGALVPLNALSFILTTTAINSYCAAKNRRLGCNLHDVLFVR